MKQTGIVFTTDNYIKVEAGVKLMTRRLRGLEKVNESPDEWDIVTRAGPWWHFQHKTKMAMYGGGIVSIRCPYGQAGDRLYAKEAHAIMGIADGMVGVAYKNRLPPGKTLADTDGGLNLFRLRDLSEKERRWAMEKEDADSWRSPLFMPKWAARLWLELTAVRVERLKDISEEDAKAEGARIPPLVYPDQPHEAYSYVANFELLWESIHGPGSWELNPFVWCLSYRKIQP